MAKELLARDHLSMSLVDAHVRPQRLGVFLVYVEVGLGQLKRWRRAKLHIRPLERVLKEALEDELSNRSAAAIAAGAHVVARVCHVDEDAVVDKRAEYLAGVDHAPQRLAAVRIGGECERVRVDAARLTRHDHDAGGAVHEAASLRVGPQVRIEVGAGGPDEPQVGPVGVEALVHRIDARVVRRDGVERVRVQAVVARETIVEQHVLAHLRRAVERVVVVRLLVRPAVVEPVEVISLLFIH